jgi:hypothetical protein
MARATSEVLSQSFEGCAGRAGLSDDEHQLNQPNPQGVIYLVSNLALSRYAIDRGEGDVDRKRYGATLCGEA